jgi:hypothetical protein
MCYLERTRILENLAAAVIVVLGIIENPGNILHKFVKISIATLLQLCLLLRAIRSDSNLYIVQRHWLGDDLVVVTVDFLVRQFLKES